MPETKSNQADIFSIISQYSLYLTVLLAIWGQWKIENHDIRLLYSLAMIIGSAVGRYGSNITNKVSGKTKSGVLETRRWWSYTILWLFGVIGLLS